MLEMESLEQETSAARSGDAGHGQGTRWSLGYAIPTRRN